MVRKVNYNLAVLHERVDSRGVQQVADGQRDGKVPSIAQVGPMDGESCGYQTCADLSS
jgi:hypothetical protein